MNKRQPGADVLARYMSGECSDREKDRVELWMTKSEENRQRFAEFRQIWATSVEPTDTDDRFDTEKEWEKLSRKIDDREAGLEPISIHHAERHYPGDRGWHKLLRVAAVFLLAGLIGFYAYQQWEPADEAGQPAALREITTEQGQRVNLTLSDGTKVLVNADSKLEIPEVFDGNEREVFLEGQAFFDVTENADKPFIIHTADTRTRVLGTQFSVRAYPADEQITIAVREGRVAFDPGGREGAEQAIVNGKEFVQYDVKTTRLQTRVMDDMELYLGWIDGSLKFREAPLHEVATELERRYSVSIVFADDGLRQMQLTALLKSRSIQHVLDVISVSLGIEYSLDGDQVIFKNS